MSGPNPRGSGREDTKSHGTTSDLDLSAFLLRVCHDLRSSLRAIRSHTEQLRKNGRTFDESQFRLHADFIVDGAQRIDNLTDGLSGYAIALQVEKSAFLSIGTAGLLRAALVKLQKDILGQAAEVTYSELPRVMGDPDRLTQVFEILLRNALHNRGSHPPQIRIAAEEREGEWLFAVNDNGPGIDPDRQQQIFRPFERLNVNRNGAAGMGLTIARAIVERHGGRLWVESIPASGSTFFFTLPAADVE